MKVQSAHEWSVSISKVRKVSKNQNRYNQFFFQRLFFNFVTQLLTFVYILHHERYLIWFLILLCDQMNEETENCSSIAKKLIVNSDDAPGVFYFFNHIGFCKKKMCRHIWNFVWAFNFSNQQLIPMSRLVFLPIMKWQCTMCWQFFVRLNFWWFQK